MLMLGAKCKRRVSAMFWPMLVMMFGWETTEVTNTAELTQRYHRRRITQNSLIIVSLNSENTMHQLRLTTLEKLLVKIKFHMLVTPKEHPRCFLLFLTTTEICKTNWTSLLLLLLLSIQPIHLTVWSKQPLITGEQSNHNLVSSMLMKLRALLLIKVLEIYAVIFLISVVTFQNNWIPLVNGMTQLDPKSLMIDPTQVLLSKKLFTTDRSSKQECTSNLIMEVTKKTLSITEVQSFQSFLFKTLIKFQLPTSLVSMMT